MDSCALPRLDAAGDCDLSAVKMCQVFHARFIHNSLEYSGDTLLPMGVMGLDVPTLCFPAGLSGGGGGGGLE